MMTDSTPSKRLQTLHERSRWHRRRLFLAERAWNLRAWTRMAFVSAALVAGLAFTSASAAPVERYNFDYEDQFAGDFCGVQASFNLQDRGVVVGRPTGPDGLPRYTQTHHGGITVTNVATGKSFTATWNYITQDVRVTDNGDGTLTILWQIPGPENWYGPDGSLLLTSGGTMRLVAIIDQNGTPGDLSDDTLISEEVVSSNGGRKSEWTPICESFPVLTA